jgi:hypothetical protein
MRGKTVTTEAGGIPPMSVEKMGTEAEHNTIVCRGGDAAKKWLKCSFLGAFSPCSRWQVRLQIIES